jgi:hypothetical protein
VIYALKNSGTFLNFLALVIFTKKGVKGAESLFKGWIAPYI